MNNGTTMNKAGGDTKLSREERRQKRKDLRAELDKVNRELQRVEVKIAKAKAAAGGKAASSLGGSVGGGKGKGGRQSKGEAGFSPDSGGAKQRGHKRKSSHGGGNFVPETKEGRKQAMLKERGRRVQSLWGQCATILKQLKQNRNAWPFHKAVDWKALNIPDYPTIVKNPMDMQTIADKLGGFDAKCKESPREYKSPLEFRDDLRLIFDNCRLYNPVGSDVRIMGDALADLFEKKWQNSNIEGKFALELEQQKREEEDLKHWTPSAAGAGSVGGGFGNLAASQGAGGGSRAAKAARTSGAMSAGGGHYSESKKSSSKTTGLADPNAVPEMSFEDKRKLSVNLGQVPAEKLGRVVQIINEGPSKIDNSEEEIELDIDKLDNQTLWRLDKYVQSCLRSSKKDSHQQKIQRMQQQQQETARKLEDVNATLASRSAGAERGGAGAASTDFSPVSSKRQAGQSVEEDKGSDSSDSESEESAEGVGSDGDMKTRGDVTMVSTTRPQSSQIPPTSKKEREVNLKNTAAWENIQTDKPAAKPVPAKGPGASGGKDGAAGSLWSEFQSREQQMKARKQQHEEEKVRKEKEREEEKRRKEEEAARRQAEERRRQEEADADRLEVDRLKEAERVELQRETKRVMKEQEYLDRHGRKPILPSLGLVLKDDEESNEEELEDEEEEGAL